MEIYAFKITIPDFFLEQYISIWVNNTIAIANLRPQNLKFWEKVQKEKQRRKKIAIKYLNLKHFGV